MPVSTKKISFCVPAECPILSDPDSVFIPTFLYLQVYLIFMDRAEFCPQVFLCPAAFTCVHVCMRTSVSSSLRAIVVDDMFSWLFTVCYPLSFCLRELLSSADHCSALFSVAAFSSTVLSLFFFPFFLLSANLDAEFLCLVRVTLQAINTWQYISEHGRPTGSPARAVLPMPRGTVRCPQSRRPPALILLDSCDHIQEL